MNSVGSLVHQQYARKAEPKDIWDRLVSALPSAFIPFTSVCFILIPFSPVDFHIL